MRSVKPLEKRLKRIEDDLTPESGPESIAVNIYKNGKVINKIIIQNSIVSRIREKIKDKPS